MSEIWLVSAAHDPAQLRRMSLVLLVAGLKPDVQLAGPQAEEYAVLERTSHPDVLVFACDLTRSDCTLLRRLSRRMPSVQTIIVSPIGSPVAVRRALDMGANGLVDELELDYTLALTVRAVCAGLVVLPKEARSSAERPIFSYREKQVLGFVVEGFSNGQIAAALGLSESTIKSHLASAFPKLGVHSRSEAAAMILDPDSDLASTALPPRLRDLRRVGEGLPASAPQRWWS
jgi:DNA-binding NarL/FixJ family response regulator